MASGVPRSMSMSTITPWIVGRPWRCGLPGKLALIFAAKTPAVAALMWKVPFSAWNPTLFGAAMRPSP